jgi:hypothetical protein
MRLDILHDDDGNILFENGDFAFGQSDQQHIGDIFIAQPGEIKEFPVVGFGAINYIKSRVSESEFKRDLKVQLQYDGYTNATIDMSKGIENLKVEI